MNTVKGQKKSTSARVSEAADERDDGKPDEKRSKGRPIAGENDVGQERLLSAAEKLLRELPPGRVTIAAVALEAGVDPSLVRYYFGNRTSLLLAVAARVTANRMTRKTLHTAELTSPPDVALADHIRQTMRLTRSAPFMHRLMIEELADAGTAESRAKVRDMNLELVAFYRRVLKADAGETMANVNPLYLHLMVLGASDFFASAQPLIREMLPRNTNMERLAVGYREFLVEMVIAGLNRP